MNPLTNVESLRRMNEKELKLGLTGTNQSWHSQYKDSAWIFTGGLPYDLTEGDIITVFSQYGEIVNLNLVRDKQTGKSRGYAFICYEDQRSTVLAVDNFNGAKVLGRTLRVDHVKDYKLPKEDETLDDITKRLHAEGCAPQSALALSAAAAAAAAAQAAFAAPARGQSHEVKTEAPAAVTVATTVAAAAAASIKVERESGSEPRSTKASKKEKKNKKEKKHKRHDRDRGSSDGLDVQQQQQQRAEGHDRVAASSLRHPRSPEAERSGSPRRAATSSLSAPAQPRQSTTRHRYSPLSLGQPTKGTGDSSSPRRSALSPPPRKRRFDESPRNRMSASPSRRASSRSPRRQRSPYRRSSPSSSGRQSHRREERHRSRSPP